MAHRKVKYETMWNLQVACASPQSGQYLQLWNDKNKFTRAEIEIFDQPVLNYKLLRVFAEPFVSFAVPRLNTALKKSVLLLSRII